MMLDILFAIQSVAIVWLIVERNTTLRMLENQFKMIELCKDWCKTNSDEINKGKKHVAEWLEIQGFMPGVKGGG